MQRGVRAHMHTSAALLQYQQLRNKKTQNKPQTLCGVNEEHHSDSDVIDTAILVAILARDLLEVLLANLMVATIVVLSVGKERQGHRLRKCVANRLWDMVDKPHHSLMAM